MRACFARACMCSEGVEHTSKHTHTHAQGFEIGSGFGGSRMLGSEHNDEFYMTEDNEVSVLCCMFYVFGFCM